MPVAVKSEVAVEEVAAAKEEAFGAAKKIQEIWRLFVFNRDYKRYGASSHIKSDENERLRALNFDHHIAAVLNVYGRSVVSHQDSYHRDASLGLARSPQVINLAKEIDSHYDCGAYYFPVVDSKTVSLENDILSRFSSYRPDIGLSLVKAPSISHAREFSFVIQSRGLVASPRQITQAMLALEKSKPGQGVLAADELSPSGAQPEAEVLEESEVLTKTIHDTLENLKDLGEKKYHPTYLLALCLKKMIGKISIQGVITSQPETVQSICLLANMAVKRYYRNYSEFADLVYSICFEISILLNDSPNSIEPLLTYEDFSKEAKDNAASRLMPIGENLETIALVANSGMHAYLCAVELAKAFNLHGDDKSQNIKISNLGEAYYEISMYQDSLKGSTEGKNYSVYNMCSGPIVGGGRISVVPGSDINKNIQTIFKEKTVEKAVLLVDCTSGLYEHLRLNPFSQEKVNEGSLIVIVYESRQKFGQLHADFVQCGRVFSIMSKVTIGNETTKARLKEIRDSNKDDLQRFIDMKMNVFFSITCGPLLEEIKNKHYKYGAIVNNLLDGRKLVNGGPLFAMILGANVEYKNYLVKMFGGSRDSFGHARPTLCLVGGSLRVSPGGSDNFEAWFFSYHMRLAAFASNLNYTDNIINCADLILDVVGLVYSIQNRTSFKEYQEFSGKFFAILIFLIEQAVPPMSEIHMLLLFLQRHPASIGGEAKPSFLEWILADHLGRPEADQLRKGIKRLHSLELQYAAQEDQEELISKDVKLLRYAAQEVQKKLILQDDGYSLKHASVALKADREVVLAAVAQDADVLRFASAELQGDPLLKKLSTLSGNTGLLKIEITSFLKGGGLEAAYKKRCLNKSGKISLGGSSIAYIEKLKTCRSTAGLIGILKDIWDVSHPEMGFFGKCIRLSETLEQRLPLCFLEGLIARDGLNFNIEDIEPKEERHTALPAATLFAAAGSASPEPEAGRSAAARAEGK